MTPELERLARKACSDDGFDPDLLYSDAPTLWGPKRSVALVAAKPGWQFYVGAVKSILTALREPTEGMLEVVARDMICDPREAKEAFRAMIDHILEGK